MVKSFSPKVSEILERFPFWKKRVLEAIELPPIDFCATVTEIFDQEGLLLIKAYDRVHQTTRPQEYKSEFCAWLKDNQLVAFYVGSEVVINRLTKSKNKTAKDIKEGTLYPAESLDISVPLILNPQVSSILNKYPQWKERVLEASKKPKLPSDFSPEVLEIFDQYGVMAGRVHNQPFETTREPDQKSDFFAWVLDGELASFYVGSEVIINRFNDNITAQFNLSNN